MPLKQINKFMQTSDKSGIICDLCSISFRDDFIYYSFDFRHAVVTDGRIPSLDTLRHTHVTCSLDVCTACFTNISQTVVENYKKIMSGTRRARPPHICELTGSMMSGNYNYYYCVITKANVQLTGQPNICTKCQKKAYEASVVCGCGNKTFIRPALVKTDNRFLEFSLSEQAFVNLRRKAEEVRKSAGSWTTES